MGQSTSFQQQSSVAKQYPPAYPHDDIKELFPNVFWVHGSIKMGPGMSMNRNMIVLREEGNLTLINPVRLHDQDEKTLCKLGQIKNLVRLGDFHGLDDQYYIDKFNAAFWCQEGQKTYPVSNPDKIITSDTPAPISKAQFFIFKTAKYPEAVLLLKDHKLLITTDAIQYFTSTQYTTWFTKVVLKLMGFKPDLLIGGPWIKRVTPRGKSMKSDFEELLELDFEHLIAAHGYLLSHAAKTKLAALVNEKFR